MITVLIPTASRPALLATALRSVSEQTAANEIAEVIVSESMGDSRSREVCEQFPNLPIKYIFREPQMRGYEHGSVLKKAHWRGEYTAILHDDDWWTPDFLRKGIEALNLHPQSSAFCCTSYRVKDEEPIGMSLSPIQCFWFGSNYPKIKSIWEMDTKEVLLATLLGTPAYYSTIIARAEALRNSAIIYDTGNRYDNDRMFIFELSRYGTILYSPIPQAFYRLHPEQDGSSFSLDSISRNMCNTTEWIIERSRENPESIGNLFYERISHCPPNQKAELYFMALRPWALPTLVKHLNGASNIAKFCRRNYKAQWLKTLLNPYIPPIVIEKGAFIRKLLYFN